VLNACAIATDFPEKATFSRSMSCKYLVQAGDIVWRLLLVTEGWRVPDSDKVIRQAKWLKLIPDGSRTLLELIMVDDSGCRVCCSTGEHEAVELRISRFLAAVLQDLNLFKSNQPARHHAVEHR
jgi:hypothetical protein